MTALRGERQRVEQIGQALRVLFWVLVASGLLGFGSYGAMILGIGQIAWDPKTFLRVFSGVQTSISLGVSAAIIVCVARIGANAREPARRWMMVTAALWMLGVVLSLGTLVFSINDLDSFAVTVGRAIVGTAASVNHVVAVTLLLGALHSLGRSFGFARPTMLLVVAMIFNVLPSAISWGARLTVWITGEHLRMMGPLFSLAGMVGFVAMVVTAMMVAVTRSRLVGAPLRAELDDPAAIAALNDRA